MREREKIIGRKKKSVSCQPWTVDRSIETLKMYERVDWKEADKNWKTTALPARWYGKPFSSNPSKGLPTVNLWQHLTRWHFDRHFSVEFSEVLMRAAPLFFPLKIDLIWCCHVDWHHPFDPLFSTHISLSFHEQTVIACEICSRDHFHLFSTLPASLRWQKFPICA